MADFVSLSEYLSESSLLSILTHTFFAFSPINFGRQKFKQPFTNTICKIFATSVDSDQPTHLQSDLALLISFKVPRNFCKGVFIWIRRMNAKTKIYIVKVCLRQIHHHPLSHVVYLFLRFCYILT